jgi:SAM-dependent methyltransferase
MSDVWSERAELYRSSEAHKEGPDLELVVEWAAGARTALDVATGGGHVARRLREKGIEVVTTDAAPGMKPDVVTRAEDLPFAEGSFDVVTCRLAAHHFGDPRAALQEMARVSHDRVVIVDNLFMSAAAEKADRVRDPSHVRNYTEAEWRTMLEQAGLEVEDARRLDKPIELEPWLERTDCRGEEAERVCHLLADRIEGGWIRLDRIALKAVKR